MGSSFTVKDWSAEDQPRERLIYNGARTLSDAELLAILLRTGCVGLNVVDLSKELLKSVNGSLHKLSQMPLNELAKFNGIGETKAVTLSAAMELGHRLAVERVDEKDDIIENSQDIYNAFVPMIGDLDHEEFWALLMNTRHKIIHKFRISTGGLAGVAVDIRPLFRTALTYNATSIAIAHNHPGGTLKPSREDTELTNRIANAGKTLNIKLIDHVIIGHTAIATEEGGGKSGVHYFSFVDSAML